MTQKIGCKELSELGNMTEFIGGNSNKIRFEDEAILSSAYALIRHIYDHIIIDQ